MNQPTHRRNGSQSGFTMIELMIAITISMALLTALGALFTNLHATNTEMERAHSQIESGRFAIATVQDDLMHAGYWGSYIPQFDSHAAQGVPVDTPTAVPDPCLPFNAANWTTAHKYNLIGIPVEAHAAIPGTCADAPASLANQVAGTDVLVVRHAATCATPPPLPAGANNASCAPYNQYSASQMYFQMSQCAQGLYNQTAQSVTAQDLAVTPGLSVTNSIKLSGAVRTSIANAYVGMTINLTSGAGAGQSRKITAFLPSSNIASVSPDWNIAPDNSTRYTIDEFVLDSDAGNAGESKFTLHRIGQNCSTAAFSDLRKFVSNIYYIRDYRDTAGDGIPTLVRSRFDVSGNTVAQLPAEALVEGIQGFHVQLGIDASSTRCSPATPVNYAEAVKLVDPSTCTESTNLAANTLAKNRGDSTPELFKSCTAAAPCDAAELTNVVAVRLHILARSRSVTPGYKDTKTYALGDVTMGPFNDGFKRHVYTTTVRLHNISDRRG